MKFYLKSIVKQLSNYSLSLDKTSILIDKPWALIDGEMEIQKLIFKKNKELVLSKNGQVQMGKWDYLPEAKSLLIDRNQDVILCNEAFIDPGVMVLKLDGTDNRFFVLANENIIPNLDALGYLRNLRNKKLAILDVKLADGQILEIKRLEVHHPPLVGNPVTIDAEPVSDGKYELANQINLIEIKESIIRKILTCYQYTNPDCKKIIVQQQGRVIQRGDYVFKSGIQIDEGIIDFTRLKNIVVRDGIVIRLERKNKSMRALSKAWKSLWGYYED